jgi:hypothetical protein
MTIPVKGAIARLTGLRGRIRDWWNRLSALRQLDGCDERDLERVLHDLNVTRFELNDAVTRGAYPKLLLPEMIHALGFATGRIEAEHPSVAADLSRVCAQCPDTKRCRHELDAGTASTNYHKFCHNASTLDALLAEAAREVGSRAPGKSKAEWPRRAMRSS